jgi:hypothetical protein
VSGEGIVVTIDLAVENDGGRSGGERFARHFKFFRIGRLKALTRENRERAIVR